MADILARPELDRMKLMTPDLPMQLGCLRHPGAGSTVIYEDGLIRLLCTQCGFEAARVRVSRGTV